MDNRELLEYVRLLREKANSNKLIVFVGAGVSCNVEGMPDWNTLIDKMAEAIKYTRCSTCRKKTKDCYKTCKFKDTYSTDEYLKIPQYVYNKSRRLYKQVLLDNIRDMDVNAPLSNAIIELEPAHIITTNYDKLIENCESAKQDNFEVIVYDRDLLNAEKKKYIIKMHGDVEYLETIVLKEADYLEYSQKHVLIEMFVKSLLTDHTILFLGYSLNDYNIKLIISWIKYIRMQNKALNADRKFGYIVVDSVKMPASQKKYFEKNNIGVINLYNMPVMENIPVELTNDIGKRLYSFLKTIKGFSLERNLGQVLLYEKSINFMRKFDYVDCRNICKLLCLGKYHRRGMDLTLFSDINYDDLISFFKTDTDDAQYLKQVFSNAGIKSIELVSQTSRREQFEIEGVRCSILDNELYQLYLSNKYIELITNSAEKDVFQECFYRCLVNGYSNLIYEKYDDIQFAKLPEERKVIYLFNKTTIETLRTFQYSGGTVSRYINGIADGQRKDMMKAYLDIQDGNTDKLLKMRESLEKLKEQYSNRNQSFIGCSSLQELYNIKGIAIEQYMFYFCNMLFFERFSDLKKILNPYIEAVICTNGQFEEGTDESLFGYAIKERYEIDRCDVDILTKFISIKELHRLLQEYKVDKFQVDNTVVDFIVECFENMCKSVIELQLYSRFINATSALVNCMTLLMHVKLLDFQKEKLANVIRKILKNKSFVDFFFSIECPEWRLSMRILSKLMKSLSFAYDFEIVKGIIDREGFWQYYANVNTYELGMLLDQFISCKELEEIQNELNGFICTFDGRKRVCVTRLLRNSIIEANSSIHKEYIAENYSILDRDDILDFSFTNWLKLSQENVSELMDETIRIYKEQEKAAYRVYPDPLESNLEIINLFYITGVINDLSPLYVMKDKCVFLQFFLDAGEFDYEKVDFSHYMWENIARRTQFMEKFVEHKDKIIPKIQRRIHVGTATELEKKILYGYLLERGELF